MIGFSVPNNAETAIVSYEGIHLPDMIYSILGLHGGTPILRSVHGERLEVLSETNRLLIHSTSSKQPVELPFEDLSGDWCKATFSVDGSWVLLGVPYELFVFKRSE